nr:uncharacterized protein LOC127482839 [Oryctolagus cuniculus]
MVEDDHRKQKENSCVEFGLYNELSHENYLPKVPRTGRRGAKRGVLQKRRLVGYDSQVGYKRVARSQARASCARPSPGRSATGPRGRGPDRAAPSPHGGRAGQDGDRARAARWHGPGRGNLPLKFFHASSFEHWKSAVGCMLLMLIVIGVFTSN